MLEGGYPKDFINTTQQSMIDENRKAKLRYGNKYNLLHVKIVL